MLARRRRHVRQLELCDPKVFGDVVLTCQSPPMPPLDMPFVPLREPLIPVARGQILANTAKKCVVETKLASSPENERRRASALVDQLLVDIYAHCSVTTDYNSATSAKSQKNSRIDVNTFEDLQTKDVTELSLLIGCLEDHVGRIGSILVRQLKRRDALRRQREAHCDVITNHLHKRTNEAPPDMRFSIAPLPGDSGFSQWHSAMKMVAQLPEGIPSEFRRRLWLTLANRHLSTRGIDWAKVERNCFSEWSHPADSELGVQIVKDLHRTGCSLFCGEDGQENQALLKKVLLAYARWNKSVGYCQGFNMLAALILQVTEKCETDALKLMIYLIEGVLPDSYFADSLRGLSVDMAVFRELLRTRLPRLSRHLDNLQKAAKDGTTSYEPPLTNVFTMQWFLTLFCNCLPQEIVLRVWDLILLEGNEILLRTALAIWQALADRILSVRSADEFYCIMGVLTREMLEFGFVDANALIKNVVIIGPLTELKSLRDHYLYNINPWSSSPPTSSPSSYDNEDKQLDLYPKEKLVLDIGVLKKQYAKLKQRQRQAHIIFSAAVSRQSPTATPVAMNHLLLGKSALVPVRRLGPPQGAIPPPRKQPPTTLYWKDAAPQQSSGSSSSDTELCDDPAENLSEDEDKGDDNLKKLSDSESLMTPDNIKESKIESPISASQENSQSPSLLGPVDNEAAFVDISQESKDNPSDDSKRDSELHSDDIITETEIKSEHYEDEPLDSDGFDFEKFLEERIRCLKQSSLCSDEGDSTDTSSEQSRVSQGRKNSQRALEIIQENSLILHRILQCQRLSPTPLPGDSDINPFDFDKRRLEIKDTYDISPYITTAKDSIERSPWHENSKSEMSSESTRFDFDIHETQDTDIFSEERFETTLETDKSQKESYLTYSTPMKTECKEETYIDPKSKYKDILEYSKNLDERYNTLILNRMPLKSNDSANFETNLDLSPNATSPKSPSFLLPNTNTKRSLSPTVSTKSYLDLPLRRSPSRDSCSDSPSQKSPNHVYNPFPVKLSSRQNKDVAVKLGLYKK